MRRACGSSRTSTSGGPATPSRRRVAWAAALERQHGPTCLLFTRQNVAVQSAPRRSRSRRSAAARYVLSDAAGARATIIATGSEVALAVGAQKALADEGVAVRVVSMPCTQRVRPPGRRLSRSGAAARHAARRGRGRRDRLLAQIRRRRRRSCRRGRRHRHASANRRRPACCSSISDSPSTMSLPPSAASSPLTCPASSIRRATPRDAEAIARVRIDGWRTTYRGLIPGRVPRRHAGRCQHARSGTRC